MTRLTRPVRRMVPQIERRGIVIVLYPNGTVGLRPARTRTEHTVPLTRVYRLACELTAERIRQDKQRARDEARRAKGLPVIRKVKRGLL